MFRAWLKAAVLSLLVAAPAAAQRAVMEGVPSLGYAIKVDTTNGRVDIATTSYNWGIVNVGLHVASNTVIDTLTTHNAVVFYATGTVLATTFVGNGSQLTGMGISTGAVTTAALTGNGQSSSPLGVNFSSVPSLGQNNVFSGSNTFQSVVEYGDSSAASISRNAVEVVWAKSLDGVSESSGCIGVLAMGDTTTPTNGDPNTLVWTSTTTGNISRPLAVLWDNTCAPAAICRFATRGPVRVQARGGGTPAFGNGVITWTTRCQADAGAGNAASGLAISGETGGWFWAWMSTF